MRTHDRAEAGTGEHTERQARPRQAGSAHAALRLQQTAGNRAVTQSIQRLQSLAYFQQSTAGKGMRWTIAAVDTALENYHAIAFPNYAQHVAGLDALLAACATYVGRSDWVALQKTKVREIAAEARNEKRCYELLVRSDAAADRTAKFRLLVQAQDVVNRSEENGDAVGALPTSISIVMETLANQMRNDKQFDRLAALIGDDLDRLRAIVAAEDTPAITKTILTEVLANAAKIRFGYNNPGTKLTPAADVKPERYTVGHHLAQSGGSAERAGSLAHELTHVAAAESFGIPPLFLLVDPAMPTDQIVTLANARRDRVQRMKTLAGTAVFLSTNQRQLVQDKLDYALDKNRMLSLYTRRFEEVLVRQFETPIANAGSDMEAAELITVRDAKIERGELMSRAAITRALQIDAAVGAHGNTLIEYDSVMTQILVYFQQWRIPLDDELYVAVREAATEAHGRRVPAAVALAG